MSVPVFLREHIAICDFPGGGGGGPDPLDPPSPMHLLNRSGRAKVKFCIFLRLYSNHQMYDTIMYIMYNEILLQK